jgi:exopolysaccharide production protein ExoQ
MSPQLATLAFTLGILGLFLLNRDKKARTSIALWIPVLWLLLAGSRNVGEWMQLGQPTTESDSAYLEGNPVDRNVLSVLLVLGMIALLQRRQRTFALLRANAPILLFFGYCGISFLWSDHPDVSFKRWVRAVGDVVMVLVVLTDRDWMSALKRLFARVGYLLLPLSILFILYYPTIGRSYGRWDGKMVWTGVTTGKNTLGMVCMIFGLGALWRVLDAYGEKKSARKYGPLIANGVLIVMAIFLLWKANSVTSIACFALSGAVMILIRRRALARRPLLVHSLVAVVVVGAFCVLFLGIGSGLLQNVGRDATLTGRTDIWQLAISLSGNPLVGTGYESFWLGSRLEAVRRIYPNHVNQVHNGYLEIFLNLGWIGVILLAVLIVSGYRKIAAAVHRQYSAADLMLAYFVVGIVYNFTEGGFKMMYPVWIFFLLATMAVLQPLSLKAKTTVPKVRSAWADLPAVSTYASLEEV